MSYDKEGMEDDDDEDDDDDEMVLRRDEGARLKWRGSRWRGWLLLLGLLFRCVECAD